MSEIKYMSTDDFIGEGFLQEANRLFFHPLGLALETQVSEPGSDAQIKVWDYRDDPEGVLFADLTKPISADKAKSVMEEATKHALIRSLMLDGETIQALGTKT